MGCLIDESENDRYREERELTIDSSMSRDKSVDTYRDS